jgi:hypothetical protein
MLAARRWTLAAFASLVASASAHAEVTYEDIGGIRYQVTRQSVPRQVPVTEYQNQQQTVYAQQVTVDNIQHQQLYTVPVTQYQLVTRMHGRFNPFITPYYTHHYVPVTTWTQQAATVSIPVSRVTWAPQTRTVQVPVTTYRTAQAEVMNRVPIGATPTALAAQPLPSSTTPSATLAARPSAPAASTPYVAGGVSMQNDPPREGTGWRAPADSRYR